MHACINSRIPQNCILYIGSINLFTHFTFSFTTKVNTDFGYHQGNSIEDGDVKQLWNELFLYEVENDIPQCYTYSQKIEIRQLFCSMFMVSNACNVMACILYTRPTLPRLRPPNCMLQSRYRWDGRMPGVCGQY